MKQRNVSNSKDIGKRVMQVWPVSGSNGWVNFLFIFVMMVLSLGFTMNIHGSTLKQITELLPPEFEGWKKSAEVNYYDSGTLSGYIDGGAELYISYGFERVAAIKYVNADSPEMTVDIFDMVNAGNAFGVFSHSRESVDHVVGDDVESEYGGGLLTFWKGKYYVSIMAYPETDAKKKLVIDMGKRIAEMIDEKSLKPALIGDLPKENLISDSIRYFHHYIWLNSHFFISSENILNIDKDTDAALAKYTENGNKYFVMLVDYKDGNAAEAAYKRFMSNYLPDAVECMKKLEDGRWSGALLDGKRIVVVLNAPRIDTARNVLKK